MSEPLVLATRNVGKLRELRPMFSTAGIDVVDLAGAGLAEELPGEDDVECFTTFAENAMAKAHFYYEALGGRAATVADDSGLELSALNGAPGVHSRRWAQAAGLEGRALDAANNARLVRELSGATDRSARFVCAAAFYDGRRAIVRLGTIEGVALLEPRGALGFGYDPHFFVPALTKTLAEATLEEKERVSHRGVAFRALLAALSEGN